MTKATEFHQAMLDGCDRTAEFGYHPNYWRQDVATFGGVAVAKKHLDGDHSVSAGFVRLWEEGHLELSMEAFVIAPYYAELFAPDEIAEAERRLRDAGFDIRAYLARIGENRP